MLPEGGTIPGLPLYKHNAILPHRGATVVDSLCCHVAHCGVAAPPVAHPHSVSQAGHAFLNRLHPVVLNEFLKPLL